MRPKPSSGCSSRDSQPRLPGEPSRTDRENELFAALYRDLERRAAWQLRRMPPSHSLQPAALVHEAYIKLRRANTLEWKSRAHFFALAVKAMREVLLDRVRRKLASKRDGDLVRELFPVALVGTEHSQALGIEEFLDLDSALARLEDDFPQIADVVMLRFYAGFTMDEIAAMSDTSRRTIERRWHFARQWLHREIYARTT